MERLAQSETYYPAYQEPDSGVTAVEFGICRLPDGFWNDFNDSTFKASGWTTQYQAMAEDENGLWNYPTGWAIPDANCTYQIQFKVTDATGTFYASGSKIVVANTVVPTAAALVDLIRAEPLTDSESLETIGGMIHAIYCKVMQKKTVTNSAEVTYKLDDTNILRTQTLEDDDTTVIRSGG